MFQKAERSQANENDIFLVYLHGFKHPDEELCRKNGLNPYMKGPDFAGHSLNDFLDFLNAYNESNFKRRADFYELLVDPNEKENAIKNEKLSIDIEFLIYMKFWEADLILRRLYNLSKLLYGQDYHWDFNQKLFTKRKTLIHDYIQNPLKTKCPSFYNLIKEIYWPKLRNAIAHSNYTFLGRNVNLEDDYLNRFSISIEDWEEVYHKTVLLGFYLVKSLEDLNQKFIENAENKQFGIPIKIPERDSLRLKRTKWLKFDYERRDWVLYENYQKSRVYF